MDGVSFSEINTDLSDVLVTFGTNWNKLLHVVIMTIKLVLLGVSGHPRACKATATNGTSEVFLMVKFVTCLELKNKLMASRYLFKGGEACLKAFITICYSFHYKGPLFLICGKFSLDIDFNSESKCQIINLLKFGFFI